MLYIKNESNNPYYNLAMEEYLFNLGDKEDYLLLWINEPTIVVGKHQNTIEEINADYVREKHINVVRRITGGGAVYHDLGNLNYSLIIKNDYKGDYDFGKFTMPIVKALDKLGVKAEQSGRNDITIDGKKFSGNAQFISKGKLLHHGTLLFDSHMEKLVKALKVSEDKIASKGIKSVRSRVTNIKDYLKDDISIMKFKELLLQYMFDEDMDLRIGQLSELDLAAIESLKIDKYLTWDWNYGQSPEFNIRKSKKFESGKVEALINVKSGIIENVKFYGDFFAKGDITDVEGKLKGQRYEDDFWVQAKELESYFKIKG
ncbi:MAG: lipoate--protein ligase [Clostridiales bacterium]|nr:lipoate--protein ligase [Clostridiales bacterium]